MNALPPPGWHIDPDDPTLFRYWDGAAWTNHRSPRSTFAPPTPAPVVPASPARSEWPRDRIGGLVAAGVLLVSAFLPWVSVETVFGSVSKNGIDGDGAFTAGLAVVLGLMFLVVNNRRGYVAAMLVAAIAAAIGLYDYIDIDSAVSDVNADSDGFASASVGIGIYGTVLGAFAGFFTALGARRALADDHAL